MSSVIKAMVRKAAPHFEGAAWHNGFKNISLKDYSGRYLVFFSYPLDFTFVCPTEILQFSDRIKDFDKLNTSVVGWSIDSKFSHMEWVQKPREKGGLGGLEYPLLSDITKKISRDYGVLIEDPNDPDCGVTARGTFIIDGNGILRYMGINDLPVGRSVDEVLRLVEAFQYTDKHGEVCPAGWEKGKHTMHPDHASSKTQDYWAKVHAKR